MRVLVFSTISPAPVDRGDRNRLTHSIRLLSSLGTVRVLYLARSWERPVAPEAVEGVSHRAIPVSKQAVILRGVMAAVGGRSHQAYRYGLPRVVAGLREELSQFRPDVLWLFQAPTVPALGLTHSARIVVDLVDSPTRYLEAERAHGTELGAVRLQTVTQWGTAAVEKELVTRAACVLVNSDMDREHVGHRYGKENVRVLPNCVPEELTRHTWRPGSRGDALTLLFVGNLAYSPNAFSVRTLAREILPLLRVRHPEARLRICGARGEALERELRDVPGIEFLGFVPDLTEEYVRANVFVSPVPFAGGTQYKLLEAMAVGVPCVTSFASAAVTGVNDGVEVVVAGDGKSYAEAVEGLLRDESRALRMSEAAKAFVRKRHVWERYLPVVRAALGGE